MVIDAVGRNVVDDAAHIVGCDNRDLTGRRLTCGTGSSRLKRGERMTRIAAAAENKQLARFRIQGDRAAKTVRRGDRPVHDPVEAVNTKLMQMHDDATAEQRRSKRAGRRFRGGGDEGDETLFHRRQQNVLFFARIPVDFVDEQHGFLTATLQPFGGRQRVSQLFDTRIDGGQLNETPMRLLCD